MDYLSRLATPFSNSYYLYQPFSWVMNGINSVAQTNFYTHADPEETYRPGIVVRAIETLYAPGIIQSSRRLVVSACNFTAKLYEWTTHSTEDYDAQHHSNLVTSLSNSNQSKRQLIQAFSGGDRAVENALEKLDRMDLAPLNAGRLDTVRQSLRLRGVSPEDIEAFFQQWNEKSKEFKDQFLNFLGDSVLQETVRTAQKERASRRLTQRVNPETRIQRSQIATEILTQLKVALPASFSLIGAVQVLHTSRFSDGEDFSQVLFGTAEAEAREYCGSYSFGPNLQTVQQAASAILLATPYLSILLEDLRKDWRATAATLDCYVAAAFMTAGMGSMMPYLVSDVSTFAADKTRDNLGLDGGWADNTVLFGMAFLCMIPRMLFRLNQIRSEQNPAPVENAEIPPEPPKVVPIFQRMMGSLTYYSTVTRGFQVASEWAKVGGRCAILSRFPNLKNKT